MNYICLAFEMLYFAYTKLYDKPLHAAQSSEYDRQASWEPISRDYSHSWDEPPGSTSTMLRPGSGNSSPSFLIASNPTSKTSVFVPETVASPRRQKRPTSKDGKSITKSVLFNVAAMCSSIATGGWDVRRNAAPAAELDKIDGRYQRVESPFRRTCSAQSAYDDFASFKGVHQPRTPQHRFSGGSGSQRNPFNSR